MCNILDDPSSNTFAQELDKCLGVHCTFLLFYRKIKADRVTGATTAYQLRHHQILHKVSCAKFSLIKIFKHKTIIYCQLLFICLSLVIPIPLVIGICSTNKSEFSKNFQKYLRMQLLKPGYISTPIQDKYRPIVAQLENYNNQNIAMLAFCHFSVAHAQRSYFSSVTLGLRVSGRLVVMPLILIGSLDYCLTEEQVSVLSFNWFRADQMLQ